MIFLCFSWNFMFPLVLCRFDGNRNFSMRKLVMKHWSQLFVLKKSSSIISFSVLGLYGLMLVGALKSILECDPVVGGAIFTYDLTWCLCNLWSKRKRLNPIPKCFFTVLFLPRFSSEFLLPKELKTPIFYWNEWLM